MNYTTNFSSAGFRFVELFGLPSGYEPPTGGAQPTVTAQFIHTDVPRAGRVTLGDVTGTNGTTDVLNKIYKMVRRKNTEEITAKKDSRTCFYCAFTKPCCKLVLSFQPA